MSCNAVLRELQNSHSAFLAGRMQRLSYGHGQELANDGEPIANVIFPESGVISLLIRLADESSIESAMIGHVGVIGGGALLGGKFQIGTTICQTPGDGWLAPVKDLIALTELDATVRILFARNEQYILAQTQQIAAWNAKHSVGQRFASWLLRACDAAGALDLPITQARVGQALGIQRASVSMVAAGLQKKEVISYCRGKIRIVDAVGLEKQACGCYQALRSARERILH